MEINFLYETNEKKYLIGKLEKNKIHWKHYYFWKLNKLEIQNPSYFFLDDKNFLYKQKKIELKTDKKLSIQQINKLINSFQEQWYETMWYKISNILVNWKSKIHVLWAKWEISFNLWIFLLKKVDTLKLKSYFWNINLNIYPNSIYSIWYIWEKIKDWHLLILGDNNTKIINLENSFYKNIESINFWLKTLENRIIEIFGKNLDNLNNLTDFHKKIYFKELSKFLEPLELFIKSNLSWDKIYLIWDTKHYPELINKLAKKTKTSILPITENNKIFKNQEETDLYFIEKSF